MIRKVLLDTGPLVALLNRRDRDHLWARDCFSEIEAPLLTCEAVLVEASHLLRHVDGGQRAVLEALKRGLVEVPFVLEEQVAPVQELQARYVNVPMSLADAYLVRMAEFLAGSVVLTLDSDFAIYRMHGRQAIPTMSPATH